MRKRQSAPWAEFAEEFAASAKAYNELGNNLGRAFYSLQAEAVAEWCEWEREQYESEVGAVPHVLNPIKWVRDISTSTGTFITKALGSLADLPSITPKPVLVLSSNSEIASDTIKEVSLIDAFELSESELEEQLPWCGPSLELACHHNRDREPEVVYSAYASSPKHNQTVGSTTDTHLHITLHGRNGQAIAVLDAKHTAAIFSGDSLTDALNSISLELKISRP